MKVLFIFLSCYLLHSTIYANDGVYRSSGGILYPVKETKISIEKEILSFTVRDQMCTVDILFEFNNPENVERKLQIGFQAPTAAGDVTEAMCNTSEIKNFQVYNNGQILPYQIMAATCENCELKTLQQVHFTPFESGVFVYLFTITCKPGINTVQHSYSFPASTNVSTDEIYNYILTTGAKWAKGAIKNLSVQFDLGKNKYFYVKDVFGANAKWSVVGVGKAGNRKIQVDGDTCRMVRVVSGKLQIDVAQLVPRKNIEFGIICNNSFVAQLSDYEAIEAQKAYSVCGLALDRGKNYTKDELKIMRNMIYAQHGLSFKTKEVSDYFTPFDWYIPNPNLTLEQIELSTQEKQFVEAIIKMEKE